MNSDAEQTGRTTYECLDCGYRFEADDNPGRCPKCDGPVQNIGVPRD